MSWLTSRHRSFGASAMVAAALLGLTGCETTGDLTVDLPDTKATSSAYLDIPVSTSTVLLDPAQTQTLKTDHYLVGRLRDQVTGLTEARAVLNLRANVSIDSLTGQQNIAVPVPESGVLESVVLVAPFEAVYGTATKPLRYDVFALAKKLDERIIYTVASDPVLQPEAIATGLSASLNATRQVTQDATDQSGTKIITTVPNLVITQPLPKDKFASVFSTLKKSTFSQTEFDAALPGIVLAPSAGYEGSIVSFGRGRVGAQIKLTFSYDSVQTAPLPPVKAKLKRTYSLYFGPGQFGTGSGAAQDARYYTQLTSDKSGSLLSSLTDRSQAVPATALEGRSYLQAGIGLGTRISFTDLTQLEALRKLSGVAINRAELRVPVQPYTGGVFPYPASFNVLEVDASNQILTRFINQIATERIVQADGTSPKGTGTNASATLLNSSSTGAYYTLLMTDYLQAYLTPKGLGETDPLPAALVLTPSLRSTTSLTLNRAVIDANNIRLRVYYSQLR